MLQRRATFPARRMVHHEQEQGIVHVASHVIPYFSIRRSAVDTILMKSARPSAFSSVMWW